MPLAGVRPDLPLWGLSKARFGALLFLCAANVPLRPKTSGHGDFLRMSASWPTAHLPTPRTQVSGALKPSRDACARELSATNTSRMFHEHPIDHCLAGRGHPRRCPCRIRAPNFLRCHRRWRFAAGAIASHLSRSVEKSDASLRGLVTLGRGVDLRRRPRDRDRGCVDGWRSQGRWRGRHCDRNRLGRCRGTGVGHGRTRTRISGRVVQQTLDRSTQADGSNRPADLQRGAVATEASEAAGEAAAAAT